MTGNALLPSACPRKLIIICIASFSDCVPSLALDYNFSWSTTAGNHYIGSYSYVLSIDSRMYHHNSLLAVHCVSDTALDRRRFLAWYNGNTSAVSCVPVRVVLATNLK